MLVKPRRLQSSALFEAYLNYPLNVHVDLSIFSMETQLLTYCLYNATKLIWLPLDSNPRLRNRHHWP